MEIDPTTLLDAFKLAPAIVALLIVIYLMYKLILSRDATIAKMVVGSQEDIARQSKMLALLEILVNRNANFRGNEGRGDRRDNSRGDDRDSG